MHQPKIATPSLELFTPIRKSAQKFYKIVIGDNNRTYFNISKKVQVKNSEKHERYNFPKKKIPIIQYERLTLIFHFNS